MTIQAVAVLQTIARDEFERDWHGFEEPFEFIQGQPWDSETPPIKEITVDLGSKSYVFPSADVVALIKHWEEIFRYEAEEEEDEDDDGSFHWGYDREEQVEEKTWAKVIAYFTDDLDGPEEAMAVLDNRLGYVVEGFKEMVAYFDMIGERMPELKPVLAEKLQAAYDEWMQHIQEWTGEEKEPQADA